MEPNFWISSYKKRILWWLLHTHIGMFQKWPYVNVIYYLTYSLILFQAGHHLSAFPLLDHLPWRLEIRFALLFMYSGKYYGTVGIFSVTWYFFICGNLLDKAYNDWRHLKRKKVTTNVIHIKYIILNSVLSDILVCHVNFSINYYGDILCEFFLYIYVTLKS